MANNRQGVITARQATGGKAPRVPLSTKVARKTRTVVRRKDKPGTPVLNRDKDLVGLTRIEEDSGMWEGIGYLPTSILSHWMTKVKDLRFSIPNRYCHFIYSLYKTASKERSVLKRLFRKYILVRTDKTIIEGRSIGLLVPEMEFVWADFSIEPTPECMEEIEHVTIPHQKRLEPSIWRILKPKQRIGLEPVKTYYKWLLDSSYTLWLVLVST